MSSAPFPHPHAIGSRFRPEPSDNRELIRFAVRCNHSKAKMPTHAARNRHSPIRLPDSPEVGVNPGRVISRARPPKEEGQAGEHQDTYDAKCDLTHAVAERFRLRDAETVTIDWNSSVHS